MMSVLIPTWNRAHYLPAAIHSIIDQTFEDWEIVIIDDGSTDNTEQIIKQFQEIEPRIRYFKRPHLGLVETLNFGHTKIKGNIVVKQDSDDESLPNRLEIINRYMKNADLFYHGIYWTFEPDRRRQYIAALPVDKKRIIQEQYIPGAFAYRKGMNYREGLSCSEDWMFLLDAVFQKRKIRFINQGLYEYFQRDDSNSLRKTNNDELIMSTILNQEYGIKDFSYPSR